MSERARVDRRRQRLRGAETAGLGSMAGVLERASSVADGAPTGAVTSLLAEATNSQAQPNALLNARAADGLVAATIQHVVQQTEREAPAGHSLDRIGVFARNGGIGRAHV